MHPEIISDKKGRCPKCGMDLVEKKEAKSATSHALPQKEESSYKPLFIIVGLIFLSALFTSFSNFSINLLIERFMIGFFLVFAGFKLIDLKGFAAGYSTYDLLAKRWHPYGYIYPFIELFFGLSMILGFYMTQVLWFEVIIMSFSGVGVLVKLMKHERFQCVCLGTFLKVPLTKVTLIEDFGMAILALILLGIQLI